LVFFRVSDIKHKNKILTQSYPKIPITLTHAIAPPQKFTDYFTRNPNSYLL
jgi:hypothetical protein